MDKKEVIQKEKDKLNKIFENVEENKRKLAESTVEQTANLTGELFELYQNIEKNKSVIVSSKNPSHQLITESAKLYNKYLNTHAVLVKTLNGILEKNVIDAEDDFDEFEKMFE